MKSSHQLNDVNLEARGQKAGAEKARHHKIANHSAHSEDHEEGEPWLLSYADMVTLLMCFFILFFSMDKTKGGISDPERIKSRLESLIGVDSSVMSQTSSSQQSRRAEQAQKIRAKLDQDLKKIAKDLKIVFSLATPEPGVLELTFLNSNFFESGQADVTDDGRQALAKIVPRLKGLSGGTIVEVEGHTDSDPVRNGKFPSNWELSSARAAAVARLLINDGVLAKQLKVAGYAEQRPVAVEKDRRGIQDIIAKKMNRRVVVRIIIPLTEAPPAGAETKAPKLR